MDIKKAIILSQVEGLKREERPYLPEDNQADYEDGTIDGYNDAIEDIVALIKGLDI